MEATLYAIGITLLSIIAAICLLGFDFIREINQFKGNCRNWKKGKLVTFFIVSLVFVVFVACVRSCLTDTSSYNKGEFNQWTGERHTEDVIRDIQRLNGND